MAEITTNTGDRFITLPGEDPIQINVAISSDYFPMDDYPASGYKPMGGRSCHFCRTCVDYYKKLHSKQYTRFEFMPNCVGDMRLLADSINPAELGEDYDYYRVLQDPVAWAKYEFKWVARWYQEECIRCSSQFKAIRAGRRIGKTQLLAVLALWYMFTNGGLTDRQFEVLIIAPYQPQVAKIFDLMREFIGNASTLNLPGVIKRNVLNPQLIEFGEGGVARGWSSGAHAGAKCLTADHDVLTKNHGWISINRVSIGDQVMTMKEDNLAWVTVSDTYQYRYRGNLVTHVGRQLSFRSTPNHRFKVAYNKKAMKNGDYYDLQADNLYQGLRIPASAGALDRSSSRFSGDELELWGWWISEGSGRIGNFARISQVKAHGRDRIVQLAKNLDLPYRVYGREIRIKWEPAIFSGHTVYDKFIPRELFDEQNIERLLQGLISGDGWIRNKGYVYSTSSQELADNVQELAFRLGYRANLSSRIHNYDYPDEVESKRHYKVELLPNISVTVGQSTLGKEKYDGLVYCITVPETGTFFTRHNGSIHLTGNSDKIRGQDADLIIMDEVDYINDSDIEVVMAILGSHPDCRLIVSSTPTGIRKKLYNWTHDKNQKFKEFWYISAESPNWNADIEYMFKQNYSQSGYSREFLAEFGDEAAGVFKADDINAALASYDISKCAYHPECKYVIGVDWNKVTGTHIVVVEAMTSELTGLKYRLVEKHIIRKVEFQQISAIETIMELDEKWGSRTAYIYVDAGYGHVQVEMMWKYDVDHPLERTNFRERVKPITMNQNMEIRDPVSGQIIKKPVKQFMVDTSARMLEQHHVILPLIEDTIVRIVPDELPYVDIGLVQQMRDFKVIKYSPTGVPTYSQDYEHTLTAWMLAIMGHFLEYSDVAKIQSVMDVAYSAGMGSRHDMDEIVPGLGPEPQPNVDDAINRAKEIAKNTRPTSRVHDDGTPIYEHDAGTLVVSHQSSMRHSKLSRTAEEKTSKRGRGWGKLFGKYKPGRRTKF